MRNATTALGIAALSLLLIARCAAAQNLLSATVVIQAEARDGHIETGAGVIVSDDGSSMHIVSAAHIFHASTDGVVGFYQSSAQLCCVQTIQAVRLDPADDLALLTVAKPEDAGIAVAPLAQREPSLGDKLTVVGHPNGRYFVAAPASVVSTAIAKYGFAFDCTACGPGDSGGGVFNAQGQLAGILLGITSFADAHGEVVLLNASFGVPASTILTFLGGR